MIDIIQLNYNKLRVNARVFIPLEYKIVYTLLVSITENHQEFHQSNDLV